MSQTKSSPSSPDLSGFVIEKYKRGFCIKALKEVVRDGDRVGRANSYLAFGDEEGEPDDYGWIDHRIHTWEWQTIYRQTREEAIELLIKYVTDGENDEIERTEKPSQIIIL